MLKIKDNVDLKELEKFGFRYDKNLHYYSVNDFCESFLVVNDDRWVHIIIFGGIANLTLSALYDLVKSGLVEKVEGWYDDKD